MHFLLGFYQYFWNTVSFVTNVMLRIYNGNMETCASINTHTDRYRHIQCWRHNTVFTQLIQLNLGLLRTVNSLNAASTKCRSAPDRPTPPLSSVLPLHSCRHNYIAPTALPATPRPRPSLLPRSVFPSQTHSQVQKQLELVNKLSAN